MNGKITTDYYLPGIEGKELLKFDRITHDIALGALVILGELSNKVHVEVIRVVLRYTSPGFVSRENSNLTADFHVIFSRFFKEQPSSKLQVMAEWGLSQKHMSVYLIDDEAADSSNKKRFLHGLMFNNTQRDTLSKALCKAVEIGINNWAERLSRSTQWLEGAANSLAEKTK